MCICGGWRGGVGWRMVPPITFCKKYFPFLSHIINDNKYLKYVHIQNRTLKLINDLYLISSKIHKPIYFWISCFLLKTSILYVDSKRNKVLKAYRPSILKVLKLILTKDAQISKEFAQMWLTIYHIFSHSTINNTRISIICFPFSNNKFSILCFFFSR